MLHAYSWWAFLTKPRHSCHFPWLQWYILSFWVSNVKWKIFICDKPYSCFAVPISYLFITLKELFLKYFSQKTQVPGVIDRIFTMTMTLYLATVCGIVYGVFNEWCQYTLNHQVVFINYKEGQQYDIWGNGSTIASGEPYQNVTNLGNVFSAFEDNLKFSKSFLILIACIVLFLFHMIEAITNCNKPTANLHFFLLSYNFNDCQDDEENVTTRGNIPLENLKEEIEKRLLEQNLDLTKSPESRCNPEIICLILKRIFLSFLGLFFIITLCCLPHFFYLLEKHDQIEGTKINLNLDMSVKFKVLSM